MASIVRNADGTFTVTASGNDAAVFQRMKTEIEARTGQAVSPAYVLDRIVNSRLNEARARFHEVDTTARQVAYEKAAAAAQSASDTAIGFIPGAQ